MGRFAAAGKTCKQLAANQAAAGKEYFYHATVIIGLETFSAAAGQGLSHGPGGPAGGGRDTAQ